MIFWISAGMLALTATAFLIYPLWRRRTVSGRWSTVGVAFSLIIGPVALALYYQVTTYIEQGLPPGVSREQVDMVAQLAKHMQLNPDDLNGWRLLGRSYMALGQYHRARQAFMEAWERTQVKDGSLKLAMAEAMLVTEPSSANGQAGQLIEEVLAAEPQNQSALWLGGFVAMHLGLNDLAVSRWMTLLELNPAPQQATILRSQIEALVGRAPQFDARSGVVADDLTININVRSSESMSFETLGAQAALFIFALAPEGGPPIAVIRESVQAVPGPFTLSDANTMLQGRSLADYDEITIVARISMDGLPTAQSGDHFAQTTVRPYDQQAIELVIDQVVP